MRRLFGIIVLFIIAVSILIIALRPELLERIWLWLVGLAGPVIALGAQAFNSLKNSITGTTPSANGENIAATPKEPLKPIEFEEKEIAYRRKINDLEKKVTALEREIELHKEEELDKFSGTTLTVLRYTDDGETTLGLLFVDNKFFCYTLEDTFREEKIREKTRIPSGIYSLGFREEATPLTLKYRQTRPWFDFHIEIQNVENFSGVYIHNGGSSDDTAGCLLVANELYSTDAKKILQNSRVTFEQLYKQVGEKLRAEQKVRIKIFDEQWFDYFKIKNKWM